MTAVGIAGFALHQARQRRTGMFLLGLYAAAGLDGLLHYTLAPMSHHSYAMNFTIWFEVLPASVLLLAIVRTAWKLEGMQPREV